MKCYKEVIDVLEHELAAAAIERASASNRLMYSELTFDIEALTRTIQIFREKAWCQNTMKEMLESVPI